jgi:hypothetical protein
LPDAVLCEPVALGSVPPAAFDTVLAATRPEEPDDQHRFVRGLGRACRTGGVVALVAGGDRPAAAPGMPGVRSVPAAEALLATNGSVVECVVPFDLLAPGAPLRRALGAEADRVLAELDGWCAHAGMRALLRFVERELVAALPWTWAGRALLLARRGGGPRVRAAVAADPATLGARLHRPAVAHRVLALVQDDAVVRFLAFVDAELLVPGGVRFDPVRYLLALAAVDGCTGAARARAAARGRTWFPGYDSRRLVEAVAHRMVERTVAAFGAHPGPEADVAASLTYPLLEACHAVLEPELPDPWAARSSS